jgi:WD40 repeat protein
MKLDGNPGTRAISVSFSDAAFVLTVLDSDRGVKVWDMRSYRCIHNLTDAPPERVKDLLSVAHYDDAQNCIVLEV